MINQPEKQRRKFRGSAVPCEPSGEKWDLTNGKQCILVQNIARDKNRETPTQLTIVYCSWLAAPFSGNATACLLCMIGMSVPGLIQRLPIRVVCSRAVVHFHIPTCPFRARPGTSFGSAVRCIPQSNAAQNDYKRAQHRSPQRRTESTEEHCSTATGTFREMQKPYNSAGHYLE